MPSGLPKAIIKKYGITKKAWRVYRGRKGKRRKTTKSRKVSRTRRRNPTVKRGGGRVARRGFFGKLSMAGIIEDVAWGYIGPSFLFGGLGSKAVPATRIVQGLAGHLMNRRGKDRLIYGLIDFLDMMLLEGTDIFSSLRNMLKISA